jgi:uncharacterized membrane protein
MLMTPAARNLRGHKSQTHVLSWFSVVLAVRDVTRRDRLGSSSSSSPSCLWGPTVTSSSVADDAKRLNAAFLFLPPIIFFLGTTTFFDGAIVEDGKAIDHLE